MEPNEVRYINDGDTAQAGESNHIARYYEDSKSIYLLSVTIENVRCFKQPLTIKLANDALCPFQWTVILGNNGVGKTTLLQCIAAIDQTVSELFIQDQQLFTHNESSIEGEIHRGEMLKATTDSEEPIPFFKQGNAKRITSIQGLFCFGYGASRRMAEVALSFEMAGENSRSLFSDEVALPNAEEWILQNYLAANVESDFQEKAKQRLEQVKTLLVNLLPDVEEVRITPPSEIRLQASVEFKTPFGWVKIKQLSLGYRTMTAWMVDLARRMFERYPNSPNPLTEPAIVLVDEIDLHLHPRWQRQIMQFLTDKFPNTQFIVTAHSPLVVQAAANANIVLLRAEGDHVVIENNKAKIQGWRVDQLLTSDLFDLPSARGPALDAPLAERKEILSKSALTEEDRARLEELKAEIGDLPTAETPQDMEAMDIIRRAATLLKGGKS